MRIALLVVAVALCWGVGRALAGGLERRERVILALMDAIQLLRIHMLDGLSPLRAALEQSRFAPFQKIGKEMGPEGIARAWECAREGMIGRGGAMDSLQTEEISVLDRFFEGLGISGKREQEALFSQTLRDLGRRGEEAGKNSRDKAKLYGTLGILAGLALGIGFL